MDELSESERWIADRLRRHARTHDPAFDPTAIVAAAVAGTRAGPVAWRRPAERSLFLALGSLAAAVVLAVVAVGFTLERTPRRIGAIDPSSHDLITYLDADSTLHLLEPNTGADTIVPVEPRLGQPCCPRWSPDRSLIAIVDEGDWTLWVVDPASGVARSLGASGDRYAWAPDGSRIATNRWRTGHEFLAVLDVDGGDGREFGGWLLFKDTGRPAWDPSGTHLVLPGYGEAPMVVVNVATGSGTYPISGSPGWGPAWSPDGSWIAYSNAYARHVVHPDGTGDQILPGTPGGTPDWSSDSRSLGFVDFGRGDAPSTIAIADVGSGTTTNLTLDSRPLEVHWSPDDSFLAYVDEANRLWVIRRDGSEPRSLADVSFGGGDGDVGFDW